MSLTFQEACRLVKPGYLFKHMRSGWSEYFTQYGRDLNGELFWTAGMTVGGPLRKKRLDTDNSGFFIYAHFRDRYPIDPKDQVERKLEPEEKTMYRTQKQPVVSKESNVENVAVAVDEKDTTEIIKNDQDLFISKLNDIVDGIASDEGGEAGHGARLAISQTLDVIDGKDGGKGYFLIAKQADLMMVPSTDLAYRQMNESIPFTTGLDIAGNLGELFEGINS